MPRFAVSAKALCLLLMLLALTACSRVELVYRNLDWLIPWKLDDYLTLDAAQRAWLAVRLDEHLRWHCSRELPRYLDWLERRRALLAGHPTAGQLEAPLAEARALLQPTLNRLAPDAARLLAGLSSAQIDELGERLAEERAKLSALHLGGTLEERLQGRVDRAEQRLEDWLGPLHPQQRAYLRLWATRQEANVRPWLTYRERWQAQLLDSLRTPRAADLATRLESRLQNPERYWDADYRRAVSRSQQALAELFSELWSSATPAQRTHLQQRLDRLRTDLAGLACRG